MEYGDIVKFNDGLGKVVKDDKGNFLFHPMGHGSYYYHELQIITEQDIEETTKEEKIEFLKKEFVWGKITDVQTVGEYIIFEYVDYDGDTYYHAFINFKNVSMSYSSLDECLIGTIAFKYDGANSQAARYFSKMIGIK